MTATVSDPAPGRTDPPARQVGSWGVPLDTATDVLPRTGMSSPAPAGARVGVHGNASATPPRTPWRPSGDDGPTPPAAADPHSHDPHEVTVQLDAVQLGAGGTVREAPGDPSDGGDGPVFVDATGRRSRRFRRLGIAVAVACAIYAVVMVATLLSGTSDAPWLPVKSPKDEQPAGKVDTTPLPERSAEAVAPDATASAGTPSASEEAESSPGTTPSAPDETTGPTEPGTSADPGPTRSGGATRPGTDPSGPVTEPTETSGNSPDPEPTDTAPNSPDPTSTEGNGEAGGGGPGTGLTVQGAALSHGTGAGAGADLTRPDTAGPRDPDTAAPGVTAATPATDGTLAPATPLAASARPTTVDATTPHPLPAAATAVRHAALSPSPEYVL
ncbi:hypothetical protein [Streptomyces sp. NPDC088789]|uniref:hypothetical protein n=1 Tax=Streptomyces sp. NPDC088789 TaxID=3365899 RepID=UPI0038195D10